MGQYMSYGDPAYALQAQIISPLRTHSNYTDERWQFNKRMSTVRQSVEYGSF